MTAMQEQQTATGTWRAGVLVVAALLLLAIWGHFEERGASSPAAPQVLVTTQRWLAFGHWPYVVVDANGTRLAWQGLAIALAASGAVLAIAMLVRRRLRARAGSAPR